MADNLGAREFTAIMEEIRRAQESVRSRFTVAVKSFSDDRSVCEVVLCTGKTLRLPHSVLTRSSFLGSVQDGQRLYELISIEFDTSTDAGKLLCELSSEIERLAEQPRAVRSCQSGDGSAGRQETVQAVGGSEPFGENTSRESIKIPCSGYACNTPPGNFSYYNAPRDIAGFAFKYVKNCQLAGLAKIGNRQLRVQTEAPYGTICGNSYSGECHVDVAFARDACERNSWYGACQTGHAIWNGPYRSTFQAAAADAAAHDQGQHGGAGTAVVLSEG